MKIVCNVYTGAQMATPQGAPAWPSGEGGAVQQVAPQPGGLSSHPVFVPITLKASQIAMSSSSVQGIPFVVGPGYVWLVPTGVWEPPSVGHFSQNCQVYAIGCDVTAVLGGSVLTLCVNDGVWAQPAMWWLNKPSNAPCVGGPFNHCGLLSTHLSCRRKEATRWFPWSAGSAPLVVAFSRDTGGLGSNCHRARSTLAAAEATSAR
jgi:hypothetical protein